MGKFDTVSAETIDALERQVAKLEMQRDMMAARTEQPSAAASRPRRGARPVAPPETICKDCGETCWAVFGQNGALLTLDSTPIGIRVLTTGLVRRERMPGRSHDVNCLVGKIGGFALCEPVWFTGWDGEDAGWNWCADKVGLRDARESGRRIYSEHALTCSAASETSIVSVATSPKLEGDAAGDRNGKRGHLAKRKQETAPAKSAPSVAPDPAFSPFALLPTYAESLLRRPAPDSALTGQMRRHPVAWFGWPRECIRPMPKERRAALKARVAVEFCGRPFAEAMAAIKSTPRPRRITPDCLPLFAELEATRGGSSLPPDTDPTPQEATQTPADSVGRA